MKIDSIKIRNYKTYRELDLDLSVSDGKSIVLIGGENGQGKTTLFEAICGAMYGLEINTKRKYQELMSLSLQSTEPEGWVKELIELTIVFNGMLNGTERTYTLKRLYQLINDQIAWNVTLSFDGNEYSYGTHTPVAERRAAEQMVNKIIKANLPKDLSNYFFFDAAKTGDSVDGTQVNLVVKQCLLSAMGFQKFHDLKSMAQSVLNKEIASRQNDEALRREFEALVEKGKELKARHDEMQAEYEAALLFCNTNKEAYDQQRQGQDYCRQIEQQINSLQSEIDDTNHYEKIYTDNVANYSHTIDNSAALPRIAEMLRAEVMTIVNAKKRVAKQNGGRLSQEQINAVASMLADVLVGQYEFFQRNRPDAKTLSDRIWQLQTAKAEATDDYHYLDNEDVAALKQLIDSRYNNNFTQIDDERRRLDAEVAKIEANETKIKELQQQLSNGDEALSREYEDKKQTYERLYGELEAIDVQIAENERRRSQYDVPNPQGESGYYNMLRKLPEFFAEAENRLIERRSREFEDYVRERLNRLIYQGENIVGRVSLGFDNGEVSFKIFHEKGNELPLTQLSTAQKQILMQVLLDATNRFGDYQPPIVIDTIMGNVDQSHREILINQYPELSQQTILFSNDIEITNIDGLDQLRDSVAQVYTLHRDHHEQLTTVESNYFGKTL